MNGLVVVGGRRGRLHDQGPAALLNCKRCGSEPRWFNYYTNRILATVRSIPGFFTIPTGIPRGTEHWLLCSTCHEMGVDLTHYELPFVVELVNAAARLESGEFGADEYREEQSRLLTDLFAMRAPKKLKMDNGMVIDYTLPAKLRTKEQRRRHKQIGGYCSIDCDVCTNTVGMRPYEPGAIMTCEQCGNAVRMPLVPAKA